MHPSITGHYLEAPVEREPIKARRPLSRHIPQPTKPDAWVLAQFNASCDLAALPTKAGPGTEDKIHILQDRYAAELPLWHPGDAE